MICIIFNNIINSRQESSCLYLYNTFHKFKINLLKGAKIDDVIGNLETTCFCLKMAIIIT